jgi:hypothetical protein
LLEDPLHAIAEHVVKCLEAGNPHFVRHDVTAVKTGIPSFVTPV